MSSVTPTSAEELAIQLREAAAARRTISVVGNDSKRSAGGPVLPSDVSISTAGLRSVLQYEPRDLTISVEAGVPFAQLQALLAENGQMIALDPPFSSRATIGGVVAANANGPMRRGYGTARDLVIGMSFAMLDGRVVKTGGMVVKNVAGLDMGKLLIGSFGTLAIMTSLNFRLHSLPRNSRTYLFTYPGLAAAIERRDKILKSVLQPIALDLISPAAAARFDRRGYVLALRAVGSPAVLARYSRELSDAEELSGDRDGEFWQSVREFASDFLERQPEGVVLRVSTTLKEIASVISRVPGACIARAASGVTYVFLSSWATGASLWKAAAERHWILAVEFAPSDVRRAMALWQTPASGPGAAAFAMMEKVKHMFDPDNLLNRLRLYGRI
ncbi:MAG TPA: FAD-binding oxidoreductase [Bryobacteraceae bacterium]|jgi:glycolate oxidase FAD binding subunit|nr:FAD-binding oxidoreductase [Bryobacteraceae bacterium]